MRDKYRLKINKNVYFKPELWNRFYKSLNEKQQPYFKIGIGTGRRVNEIRGVEVQHCNLDQEVPTIIFYKTKVKAKKKETRPVPKEIKISTELASWLKRWIRKHKLKKEDTFNVPTTPAINKVIKHRLKKLGLTNYEDYSSHNVRKTHGNYLLAVGMDGVKVATRLGHSADTLSDVYASDDIFSERDREMIKEILGDLIERK